jgi:hypothetical protein
MARVLEAYSDPRRSVSPFFRRSQTRTSRAAGGLGRTHVLARRERSPSGHEKDSGAPTLRLLCKPAQYFAMPRQRCFLPMQRQGFSVRTDHGGPVGAVVREVKFVHSTLDRRLNA